MGEGLDFGAVLQRDIDNIISKTEEGIPLNARERDLILSENEKRKRDKLPEAEREKLEPIKKRSGRQANSIYDEGLDTYAETYKVATRTIKKWIENGGKQKPDPIICPLDHPWKMRAWWASCMKMRCPPGVINAEAAYLKTASPELAGIATEQTTIKFLINSEELGLDGAQDRLNQLELELSRRATEPGQAKVWMEAVARMTSLATNVRREKEAQDLLVSKAEVAQALQDYLQPIEKGIRQMYPAFCTILGQPPIGVMEDQWLKECDKLFERFGREIFA